MNGPMWQHGLITGRQVWQMIAMAPELALSTQGAHDVRRAILPDAER
ncbi:MAG: hypothetical protein ACRERE_24210 [Candidatus Entotheonellia bacterium]